MTGEWQSRCGACDWGEFVDGDRAGVCRKFPPVVAVRGSDLATVWPTIVRDVDWCAQYTPRRERPWTVQAVAQGDGGGV